MKVGTKLCGALVMILALLVVSSVIAATNLESIANGMTAMKQEAVIPLGALAQAEGGESQVDGNVASIVAEAAALETSARETARTAAALSLLVALAGVVVAVVMLIVVRRQTHDPLERCLNMVGRMRNGCLSDRLAPTGRNGFATLEAAIDALAEHLQHSVIGSLTRIAAGDFAVDGRGDEMQDEWTPVIRRLRETLDSLVTEVNGLAKATSEGDLSARADVRRFEGGYQHVLTQMNGALDAIVTPLREASKVVERMVDNDMTLKVAGDYRGELARFKELLNAAIDSRTGVVKGIRGYARTVAELTQQLASASQQAGDATQQIATTSQQVARGANQQSDALQQSTNGIEQLTKAIERIARGAQQQARGVEESLASVRRFASSAAGTIERAQSAAEGSRHAADSAREGSHKAKETVAGMARIKNAIGVASGRVSDLGARSDEIGKIVATIDDISAQTNLLALNAAIEAARAGEQGRGFAVVADEVRKLAERSLGATKEIAELIQGIQNGVQETIVAMDGGNKEIESGYSRAIDAGDALEEILSRVEEVGRQIGEIAAGGEQMSELSSEMLKPNEDVSSVVEENTASTQQMAASSDQVSRAIESVAGVAEENSAAAEQVSGSTQQVSAQVEQVVASTQQLAAIAEEMKKHTLMVKISDDLVAGAIAV